MITFDYELITDLTLILQPGDVFHIKINGRAANCILSTKIIDVGATYIVKSCMESTEFLRQTATVTTDLNWEFIKVDGVEYAEVTFDIPSLAFKAPNIIYVENTSDTETLMFSLRGNR